MSDSKRKQELQSVKKTHWSPDIRKENVMGVGRLLQLENALAIWPKDQTERTFLGRNKQDHKQPGMGEWTGDMIRQLSKECFYVCL